MALAATATPPVALGYTPCGPGSLRATGCVVLHPLWPWESHWWCAATPPVALGLCFPEPQGVLGGTATPSVALGHWGFSSGLQGVLQLHTLWPWAEPSVACQRSGLWQSQPGLCAGAKPAKALGCGKANQGFGLWQSQPELWAVAKPARALGCGKASQSFGLWQSQPGLWAVAKPARALSCGKASSQIKPAV